ncbi:MAG: hypothetical protein K2X42_01890 [Burkholderiaceae bacterium]|nr:hypothetical protein [Burkholderiaceae bacterium]
MLIAAACGIAIGNMAIAMASKMAIRARSGGKFDLSKLEDDSTLQRINVVKNALGRKRQEPDFPYPRPIEQQQQAPA